MKRAFLGMPGYGQVDIGASRGFWRASKGKDYDLTVQYASSSSLTQNFNALWALALNEGHKGTPYTYFAMLHSDVEPEDFWLDKLIAELEEHKLDVISAVIPIKDQKGLTSTALARDDGDTWRPLCRLTMREALQLPQTFTAKDVGHPLLLNTGCWVCRWNQEWATKIVFDINNRIVFSKPRNCYVAQFEPEDWYFSRTCNDLGLKIAATRIVPVQHVGTMRFSNTHVWGSQSFDSEYVPESIIAASSDSDGFRYPHIDGWLLHEEGKTLWNLARGKRVLEIGSYCGKSTICMAQSAEHVTCIDPFNGNGTPKPRDTASDFCTNLKNYGLADRVTVIPGQTSDVAGKLLGQEFDLIFIDGDHSEEAVRTDIEWAMRLLAPDGILAFHDFRTVPGECDNGWDPGVTKVVTELVDERGGDLLMRVKTLAVVKPCSLSVLEQEGVALAL